MRLGLLRLRDFTLAAVLECQFLRWPGRVMSKNCIVVFRARELNRVGVLNVHWRLGNLGNEIMMTFFMLSFI